MCYGKTAPGAITYYNPPMRTATDICNVALHHINAIDVPPVPDNMKVTEENETIIENVKTNSDKFWEENFKEAYNEK